MDSADKKLTPLSEYGGQKSIPEKNYTLWLGAVDDELTAKAYIVPGIGDAGDLAYGPKE